MGFKKLGFEGGEWIELAQDRINSENKYYHYCDFGFCYRRVNFVTNVSGRLP